MGKNQRADNRPPPALDEEEVMDRDEFRHLRKRLEKTQKQMANLLGVSLKAVHSYEQGWRVVPPAVERQLFFLVSRLKPANERRLCWQAKDCPPEHRAGCPASELNSGELCWFINGTVCRGQALATWEEKMKICRTCDIFLSQVSK
jgi:DNA-binding transcriptional regulator YiaG